MKFITLKPGREKSVRHRHPWVLSGAVQNFSEGIEPGEIVDILGSDGTFLARGYYNSRSNIRARVLEWDGNTPVDREWWKEKIRASIARRKHIIGTDSMRLVFAEADFIPGLIVDSYAGILVMQVLTAGIE